MEMEMEIEKEKGEAQKGIDDDPRMPLARARQMSRAVKYLAEEWMRSDLESAYIMAAGIHANWMIRYAESLTELAPSENPRISGTPEDRLTEYTETIAMVQDAKKAKADAEGRFGREHRKTFDGIKDGTALPYQRDKNLYRALLFWIGACASVHADLVIIKGAAGEAAEYPSRRELCEKVIEEAAERAEWDLWNAETLPVPGPPYMKRESTVRRLTAEAKRSRNEARRIVKEMRQGSDRPVG